MTTIRILILEDDLETVYYLFKKLAFLEDEISPKMIAATVLSEYTQVEEYINNTQMDFDVILLDRDCKAGGSFHALDFEKFGTEKIISISSTPPYNEEARKKGVSRVVWKDYENLETFADQVIGEIKKMI